MTTLIQQESETFYTLSKTIWRTPDAWGKPVYCTHERLYEILADLWKSGIDAVYCDADQFILVGDCDRAVARGWYHRPGYSTSGDRTYWTEHCVMVDSKMAVLKESFIKEIMPGNVTAKTERAVLMRCLAAA